MSPPRLTPAIAVLALMATAAGGCRCSDDRTTEAGAGDRSLLSDVGRSPALRLLKTIQQEEWRRVDAAVIRDCFAHSDAEVRARAALAAGRAGLLSTKEALGRLVADPDSNVRRQAAFALRLIALDAGDPAVAERVAAVLRARLERDRDPLVRPELIVSLGWTGSETAATWLGQVLSVAAPRRAPGTPPTSTASDDPSVRSATDGATADGNAADVNAAADGVTREEAASALVAAGLLGYRDSVLTPARAEQLAAAVAPYLGTVASSERLLAAWALARLQHHPAAVKPALRRLADATAERDPLQIEARAWAIRALSALGSAAEQEVEWLAQHLHDPDVGPQVEALRGLGRGGVQGAIKLCSGLLELWRSIGQSHFRLTGQRLRAMLVGLEALEPHANTAVVRRLGSDMLELSDASDAAVRYSAIEAHAVDLVHCAAARLVDLGIGRPDNMASCGTARAATLTPAMRRAWLPPLVVKMNRSAQWKLTLLRRYLQAPDEVAVRVAAVQALEALVSPLVEVPLLRALEDADVGVLGAAATVAAARTEQLSIDGRQRAARSLARRLEQVSAMKHPEVVCDIARALGRLGERASLRPLLQSPSWAVRACALERLRRHGVDLAPRPPPSRGLPPLEWAGDRPLPTRAVIVTDKGEIHLQLRPGLAPATVANLARLASRRFYRGIRFHRVAAGFVVQGGDPRGDGRGGPGHTIPCELSPTPFVRGSVGMALAGRDTGGSQFFITLGRQPHLDGRYTLFGHVVKGMDTVDRLHVGDVIKDLYIP